MSLTVSSFIRTGNAAATRNRDQLSFPYLARPQAMTVYARFLEQGTIKATAALAWRIFQIGDNTSAKNYLDCWSFGTGYRARYDNGVTFVNADTASAPSIGDLVELRVTLTAAGVLQISQTVNNGTEASSATATAHVLPQQWVNLSAAADQVIRLGNIGTVGVGFMALLNCCVARGVQSLTAMRRFANVGTR